MRVPEPPQAYIELKCALHGADGDERELARKAFFKRLPDFRGEIEAYQRQLAEVIKHNIAHAEYALAREKINYVGDGGSDPIECIHRMRGDEDVWGLVVDFDFYRDGMSRLKRANVYIALYPERLFESATFRPKKSPTSSYFEGGGVAKRQDETGSSHA